MGDDGTSETIPGEPHAPSPISNWLRRGRPFFNAMDCPRPGATGRPTYCFCSVPASILVGGWAPWLVLAVAMLSGVIGRRSEWRRSHGAQRRHLPILQSQSLPVASSRLHPSSCPYTVRRNAAQPHRAPLPIDRRALASRLFVRACRRHCGSRTVSQVKSTCAKMSAYMLLGFTGNTSFVTYHLYAHHRQVGTYNDASTARRGERLRTFMARTLVQQFIQAARIEAVQTTSARLGTMVMAQPLDLSSLGRSLPRWNLFSGGHGVFMIVAAGLLGRLFHELINYVQHYGLVRLENFPVKEHHSWDCYRTISNSLHYNLPRHSDHHMSATRPRRISGSCVPNSKLRCCLMATKPWHSLHSRRHSGGAS